MRMFTHKPGASPRPHSFNSRPSGGKNARSGQQADQQQQIRQALGNQGVQRQLQRDAEAANQQSPSASPVSFSVVEHHKSRISASIRRADNPDPASVDGRYLNRRGFGRRAPIAAGLAPGQQDAMRGGAQVAEVSAAALLPRGEGLGEVAEPEAGQSVQLPEIAMSGAAGIEQADAISSSLSYNSSIAQSGPPPSPFGATMPYTHTLSGISVTSTPGTYNVSATVDNPITFQVTSGGNTDIASDSDSDITQANYGTVVSDLTPDMSDLNGRPPRTQFWAEDLCIRHERFHATEDVHYGRSGVTQAQTWLNSRTASGIFGVYALLGQVPGRVAATVQAGMSFPGRENRAYGDGAPHYLARANAIKAKGDAGSYATATPAPAPAPAPAAPTAPTSSGMSRGAKTAIGVGGGALAGAGIGAAAGGPVGALIGAGVGAVVGGIGSLFF